MTVTSAVPPRGAPVPSRETLRGHPSLATCGLLVVQMIVGYEWFVSGLVKILRGDFPRGLAAELAKKSEGIASWYALLMQRVFIPNAEPFGYVIQFAEFLAGIVLIIGPLLWIAAWERLSDRLRGTILFLLAGADLGGAFLAINLHLANGASHPWLIPRDSFDEGIDLDSVLPAVQLVIAWVSIVLLRRLRRT